jgi:hypothetical protein
MWPWGHLAVGYLLSAGAAYLRDHSSPRGLAVVALAAGTQLPDLLDKPLASAIPLSLGVLSLS